MFGHDPQRVGARGQSRVIKEARMLQLGCWLLGRPMRLQSVRLDVVPESPQKTIMSNMQSMQNVHSLIGKSRPRNENPASCHTEIR